MLHEFLTANRKELIERCLLKVSKRDSPPPNSSRPEQGVPVFLGQLVAALRLEEENPDSKRIDGHVSQSKVSIESTRTAALHGKRQLDAGYTVEQVVHGYGDICQSITELAKEREAPVTVDEFHTLNRLLDNAIADAVSSYRQHSQSGRESIRAQSAQDLHERMGTLAEEQRDLLDRALKALDAIKVGNIGVMGATGTVLEDSLVQLRDLIDKSLPELRLSAGMTTPQDEER